MDYLEVKNWEEFQHYKDRSPPWIKFHRSLLTDYDFGCLQDASKLHLVLIWLFASQCDNKIPDDPEYLQRALHLEQPPDLKLLVAKGFLLRKQSASKPLAACQQSAMPEAEAEERRVTVKDSTNESFTAFWSAYPKKVAKADAVKAWKGAKGDKHLHAILADIGRRKLNGWTDPKFIPHPSTYLRGRRWEDEDTTSKEVPFV